MAAALVTEPNKKLPQPSQGGFEGPRLSKEKAQVRAIAEIVSSGRGENVNLNTLKSATRWKYGLARAPKLVEMIVVSPDSECNSLLAKLRGKPVCTAFDIVVVAFMSKLHCSPHIATTGIICIYYPGNFEHNTQSYIGDGKI